jgi:hypothetical protein
MLKNLREKRAKLMREAEALRNQDGTFENDEKRSAFDTKMASIHDLDVSIRTLEAEGVTGAPPAAAAPAAVPAAPASAAAAPSTTDAVAAERQRAAEVQAIATRAGLDAAFVTTHIGSGASIDAVRSAAFTALVERDNAAGGPAPGGSAIRIGEDARDKYVRGGVNWLLVRSGMAALVAKHEKVEESTLTPGEFRGLTLLDMAKDFLSRHRVEYRGMNPLEIAGLAFNYRAGTYQTTSDFAVLFENTMHKVLRAAYALAPDTWSQWCGIATVTDFRTHNWYRQGSLTQLDDINEHGEFKNKSIPDAEKATYSVGTKGNIIAVSRQAIVNDDLGGLTNLSARLGRAGKLTIENAVYALLNANAGLGPTQADTQPLFHANRANVGAGAALSVPAIDADRVVMAQQKDPNGVDFLDLRPEILLVGIGLGGQARTVNEMQFDADQSNKFMKPNIVRGLFKTVVDTPRITGTRRYLFADPSQFPVFLVAFLEGQREPVIETQAGWRVDGVELKARLDFGVSVVDYRGAVTNAGV